MTEEFSIQTFEDLEQLLSPFFYGDGHKHPPPTPGTHAVPQGLKIRGTISDDCQFAYVYNASVIRCVPVVDNLPTSLKPRGYSPLAINTAGYAFPGSIIRSVAEIPSHLLTNNCRGGGINKLLLGLDSGSHGRLVIFDPIQAKPLQTITLPTPVTCVTILSHPKILEDEFPPSQFYNEAMLAMVGIAAVGLDGGDVILLDLGIDDLQRRLNNKEHYIVQNGETNLFTIVQVEPREGNIAQFRHESVSNGRLIYLPFIEHLPENLSALRSPESYYFENPRGKVVFLPKADVSISAMKYIPNCGYLVVGFNFGLFQIWNVSDMVLEYALPIDDSGDLNIHSFEFQVPFDDPRNFAYLWILQGNSSAELGRGKVDMYALEFEDKRDVDNPNYHVFSGLKMCAKRLTLPLCDCYHRDETDGMTQVRPFRVWTLPSPKESLVFISWEAARFGTSYIGIFDLNQWYSAQTPDQFNVNSNGQLNSFWSAVKINKPEQMALSQVWDVKIPIKSLYRWFNPYIQNDLHLFPASLTFQGICLTSNETFMFEHYGIQEKLLRLIQRHGYDMMSEPTALYEFCNCFGMIPYSNPSIFENGSLNQKEMEQYFILTLLLENHRSSLIVQMANHWSDGASENIGCGFSLLLEWVKWLTLFIRHTAEHHWIILLFHDCDDLPPETEHFLEYSHFAINQLLGIINILLRPMQFEDDEAEECENLRFGITKLSTYTGALLFLRRAKLLPKRNEDNYNTVIQNYYENRRAEMKTKLENCQYLFGENGGHPLLVDYLFENLDEDFLKEEWELEEAVFYPPKHIRNILDLMLGSWIHVPEKHISRIIYYYILDLKHFSSPSPNPYLTDLVSVLNLTNEDQSYISLLWKIDHQQFADAVRILPAIDIDDEKYELPWSAALVHLAASGYERTLIDKIRGGLFPAKISRFVLNVVCLIEPGNRDLVAMILYAFSYDPDVLEPLFRIADSNGALEEFIFYNALRFRPSMRERVANYLKSLPNCIEHEIRLLHYYVTLQDLKSAINVYKRISSGCSDRRFLPETTRSALGAVEDKLRTLYKRTEDIYGSRIGDDEEDERSPSVMSLYDRPRTIKLNVEPVKMLKVVNSPEYKLLPPQFRRLMKNGFEMKPGKTPLSPLRRYVGRIMNPKSISTLASETINEPTTTSTTTTPENVEMENDNESCKSTPHGQGKDILDILELLRTPILKNDTPTSQTYELHTGQHRPPSSLKSGPKTTQLKARFLNLSSSSEEEMTQGEQSNLELSSSVVEETGKLELPAARGTIAGQDKVPEQTEETLTRQSSKRKASPSLPEETGSLEYTGANGENLDVQEKVPKRTRRDSSESLDSTGATGGQAVKKSKEKRTRRKSKKELSVVQETESASVGKVEEKVPDKTSSANAQETGSIDNPFTTEKYEESMEMEQETDASILELTTVVPARKPVRKAARSKKRQVSSFSVEETESLESAGASGGKIEEQEKVPGQTKERRTRRSSKRESSVVGETGSLESAGATEGKIEEQEKVPDQTKERRTRRSSKRESSVVGETSSLESAGATEGKIEEQEKVPDQTKERRTRRVSKHESSVVEETDTLESAGVTGGNIEEQEEVPEDQTKERRTRRSSKRESSVVGESESLESTTVVPSKKPAKKPSRKSSVETPPSFSTPTRELRSRSIPRTSDTPERRTRKTSSTSDMSISESEMSIASVTDTNIDENKDGDMTSKSIFEATPEKKTKKPTKKLKKSNSPEPPAINNDRESISRSVPREIEPSTRRDSSESLDSTGATGGQAVKKSKDKRRKSKEESSVVHETESASVGKVEEKVPDETSSSNAQEMGMESDASILESTTVVPSKKPAKKTSRKSSVETPPSFSTPTRELRSRSVPREIEPSTRRDSSESLDSTGATGGQEVKKSKEKRTRRKSKEESSKGQETESASGGKTEEKVPDKTSSNAQEMEIESDASILESTPSKKPAKKPSRKASVEAPPSTPTRELRSRSVPTSIEPSTSKIPKPVASSRVSKKSGSKSDDTESSFVEDTEPQPSTSAGTSSKNTRLRRRSTKSESPERATGTRQLRSRSEPKQMPEPEVKVERKRTKRRSSSGSDRSVNLDESVAGVYDEDEEYEDLNPPKLRRHLKGFDYSPKLSTVLEDTESSSMLEQSSGKP